MKSLNLTKIKDKYQQKRKLINKRIIVCAGTGCLANGSLKIYEEFLKEFKKNKIEATVELDFEDNSSKDALISKSGCQGFCEVGPLVTIKPDNIFYKKVKVKDVQGIVKKTIINDELLNDLIYTNPANNQKYKYQDEIPFYSRQRRTVLKNCGNIDPEDIREYIYRDGYFAAQKVYTQNKPIEICDIIKQAGLRGRGGGGFPTGKKWELTLKQNKEEKYIICNGDEGDPGAFMDRSILEGNPHSIIEGMMIGAKAIGAHKGYIYVRAEYPLAVERMIIAIDKARKSGILGKDIFGSGFDFDIEVMEGAGAFVCGEASAMVASIMGNRGMPRPKPPRTAEKGLWDKPTVVNNVETLATVPLIVRMGADNYRKSGTESSPGTKTFALTGHVANTGLIEVPFGTTLREIIFDIGGGVLDREGNVNNSSFKAVQIGGPSGGCLTEKDLDIPLDFDSLKELGAMVGSGGLVVMNDSTCMVQVAKFFMEFTKNESCGKCIPCREGTRQMLELLNAITDGKADENSLKLLENLSQIVASSSLCGLGKSAPLPIISTINQFRDEYEAHVKQKICPTNQCAALKVITIEPELCKGCGLCKRVCPVNAILGDIRKPHKIDPFKCIKCGACIEKCKFGAISGGQK